MIVEKKRFAVNSFLFEKAKRSIPVEIGYETYGTLNGKGDNVVLICHYFTGNSHCAGKYKESDPASGWWDRIIGSGKIIDTDKYFVICSDSISNINYYNPNVITTGPPSINPLTQKPYGMDFPVFTLKDVVRLQKMLMDHLGVKKIQLVMGASMGGLQAFMWGRYFPKMIGKIISVVATPMIRPYGIMIPNQLGIDAIRLDPHWNGGDYYGKTPPHQGLLLAFKILLMSTRTDIWAEANFQRKIAVGDPFTSFDGKFMVEREVENIVLGRMEFFDANSYMYIAKANILYDLREEGESKESAWSKITPPVLMIIDESDLLFNKDQAEEAKKSLPDARCFYYNSGNGHLSCLFDLHCFESAIAEFFYPY